MAGDKADVLMMEQLAPIAIEGIGKAFTLHKLWEAPDRERLIGELAPRLRAIAAGGPFHDRVDAALMARLPKLEMISSFGVGYDHVDAKWAGEHGITVTNTPDVLNEEVADTALGLLLCTVRELSQAERYLRAGKWVNGEYRLTASLRGRRAGIVGLGRIGMEIARRLEGFKTTIGYADPIRRDVAYRHYPDAVALARDSDIVFLAAAGAPKGAGQPLVGRPIIDALGPRGIFVNIARGWLVDEPALIAALAEKRLGAAGLDVFYDEPAVPDRLLRLDNVVMTPHVASATEETAKAMGDNVVGNLVSWFAGRGALTPVT